MKWTYTKAAAAGLCLAGTLLAASGCLVTSNSSVAYGCKGQMVSQETLNQIDPGKTPETKLIALLGEPTNKKQLSEQCELYTYDYIKKTHTNVTVFLVLTSNESSEHRNRLYFEIEDGLVQKFWQDSSTN